MIKVSIEPTDPYSSIDQRTIRKTVNISRSIDCYNSNRADVVHYRIIYHHRYEVEIIDANLHFLFKSKVRKEKEEKSC